MIIYTTKVIPVSEIVIGRKINWTKVKNDIQEDPLTAILETLSIVMMIIGIFKVGDWTYNAGFWIGTHLF